MSAVKAVNYLLSQSAAVTALVPAVDIVSGVVPQGTGMPCILVRQVSGVERLTVDTPSTYFKTDRVQVTAITEDYDSKLSILSKALLALVGQRGSINGVKVDSILPDGEGPDIDDPGMPRYERSRDFIVKWHLTP